MKSLRVVGLTLLRIAGAVLGGAFIIYLNWLVIRGWFGGQGPANLGSIEVSYVSMGRFLVDFGWPGPFAGQASWVPLWYLGFPFHLFYTPLLPVLEWLLHEWQGMHLWTAYRFVTGWAYILSPVSLFFLGWTLSRRWIGGLVAGILYSVGPTIFYFLESEVMGDRISGSFLDPRRFTILVRWGEGPHILSLVFLPLVGALFTASLRGRHFWFLVLAGLAFVLTAVSNALGMLGALILVGSIAFVRYAQQAKRHVEIASWTALFVAVGFGMASFWYNLSFIRNFFGEGGTAANIYISLFPWGWLAGVFTAAVLYFLIRKVLKNFGVAVALVWFALVFCVVYVYYASAPSQTPQLRIELLPQALRYMAQVDMAFSVLVGVLVSWLVRLIGKRSIIAEIFLTILLAGASLSALAYIQPFLGKSADASSKVVDLSRSREKVIADWTNEHVDREKGERVFVPGNYGFYLNWFSDVWQLRGGLYQAATHYWPDHIHYQLANGKDAEVARAWLVSINAKYIVVTGPGSSELYREMKNLERFLDLTPLYEEQGDIIYEVPLVRDSPAKPVRLDALRSLSTPSKADDKDALLAYADWVEGSSLSEADFRMLDHDSYTLTGRVDEGEALLVQMTADPGWSALRRDTSRGELRRVRTGSDPLGFLLLYPEPGDFSIELTHRSTWKQWLGYATSLATLVGIIWYGLLRMKRTP